MAPDLNTYDDVPVSLLAFDAGQNGWAKVPRQLLVDWLAVLARVTQAVSADYRLPVLPDPLEFICETIASDGPYGSSENFYYLSHFRLETDGLLLHFEYGRQGEDEPLVMETSGLSHNVTSTMDPKTKGPARARFFVFHTSEQGESVKRALPLV